MKRLSKRRLYYGYSRFKSNRRRLYDDYLITVLKMSLDDYDVIADEVYEAL